MMGHGEANAKHLKRVGRVKTGITMCVNAYMIFKEKLALSQSITYL